MASAVLSPNADTRERSKSSGGLLGNDMDSRVGDSRLRVELRQANYRADELKTELSSAKDVIEDLKRKELPTTTQVAELEADLEQAHAKIDELNCELQRARERLIDEIREAAAHSTSLEKDIEYLQSSLNDAQAALKAQKKDEVILTEKFEIRMAEQLSKYERAVVQAAESAAESQLLEKKHSWVEEELEKKNIALNEMQEKLVSHVEGVRVDLAQFIQSTHRGRDEALAEAGTLKVKHQVANLENERLIIQNEDLQQQLVELTEENRVLKAQAREIESDKEMLETSRIRDLEHKVTETNYEWQVKMESASANIRALEEEVARLQRELDDTVEPQAALEQWVAELTNRSESLKAEVAIANATIADLQAEVRVNASAEARCTTLMENVRELQISCANAESMLAETKHELRMQQEEMKLLKKDLESQTQRAMSAEAKYDALDEQARSERERALSNAALTEQLRGELKSMTMHVKQADVEQAAMKAKLHESQADLQKMKFNLDDAQTDLLEASTKSVALKEELMRKDDEIERRRHEMAEREQLYQNEMRELQTKAKDTLIRAEYAEQKFETEQGISEQVRMQNDQLGEELKEVRARALMAEDQSDEARSELSRVSARLEAAQFEKDMVEQEARRQDELLEEQRTELIGTDERQRDWAVQRDRMMAQIEKLSADNSALSLENTHVNAELDEQLQGSKELRLLEHNFDELTAKNNALSMENGRLNTELDELQRGSKEVRLLRHELEIARNNEEEMLQEIALLKSR